VVTLPLLTAGWYIAELERRQHLIGGAIAGSVLDVARRIADRARTLRRPVVVALTVSKAERAALGGDWIATGLVAVDRRQAVALTGNLDSSWSVIPIAVDQTTKVAGSIDRWLSGRSVHPSVDPVHEYIQDVLSCPRWALEKPPSQPVLAKLDSLCNLR